MMAKKNKKTKEQNPNKLGGGTLLLWSMNGGSAAVQVVLLSYLTVYLTNALGMNVALVGALLMGTKIFDGFTDLFAGYIVDRTNTKIGRGRPYDLCILGLWLTTWLLFSVPTGWSTVVKSVYVVICYTLCQSVFKTFMTAGNTPYMVRAFNNEQKYVKLNSWGGMVTTSCVMVFNVIFPMFYANIIYDPAGWSSLVGFIAVPLAIIGILRFFFIPEKYVVEDQERPKTSAKDVVTLLKSNKYIYPIAILQFVIGIGSNISVSSYYYQYIVGDVSISGIMSLFSIIAMLSLIFYPMILRHISTKQLIQYSLLISIASAIIGMLAYDNLALLAVAGVLNGFVTLPVSYMSGLLVIDCADYNEWKGNARMEATLASVTGFMGKIGTAFASFLTGLLLDMVGFTSGAETQSGAVLMMIRIGTYIVPMAFYVFSALVLKFYTLDKQKAQINADLAEQRAAREAAAAQE